MDSITGKQTSYSYDADNRLASATGKTGETVDYTQQNQYNGFGQRVKKQEGSDITGYLYDGMAVLYTKAIYDGDFFEFPDLTKMLLFLYCFQ